MHDRRGIAWPIAIAILKPLLVTFTRHEWRDGEKLPAEGGCIIVANHTSHVDPLTLAHLMHDHGRLPRFLAKAALFDVFFLGWVMRDTGQISVARQTTEAASAYGNAVRGVHDGKAVVFYPEGTITRDPGLWPMVGKSGAARVGLESGAPVIPIAQWGPHRILYPYAKKPKLVPPQKVLVQVGDPVYLDDLRGQPISPAVLHEATDRIMAAITALLEDLRAEVAPTERYDPQKAGVRRIGNPYKAPAKPARSQRRRAH